MAQKIRPGLRLVFARELRRIVSRPIYLIMMFFLPLGSLLFFGTLMSDGLPEQLPIAVVDHDASSLSRKFIRQLEAGQQTKIVRRFSSFHEARNAVQKNEVFGFLEIPENLMKDVTNGMQPTIHFYFTQGYLIPGSLVLKNMSYTFTTLSAGVNLQVRQAKGQVYSQAMAQVLPISPDMHAIGNPWINYAVYLNSVLLPGMLQLLVLLTTVYVIGLEIKKERSFKWYRLSGRNLSKALIGKLIPYTIAFTLMGCIFSIVMYKVLHYPMHANMGWMFLNYFTMIVAYQAMGVFMISMFPTLPVALSISGLFGVLGVSYSGLSFPIEAMPLAMQGLGLLFPIKWFFKIYQGAALNGLSYVHFVHYYLIQFVYLLFPFILRKRLLHAVVKMDYPKY
jgi:ABC-2 type transport system permease protein